VTRDRHGAVTVTVTAARAAPGILSSLLRQATVTAVTRDSDRLCQTVSDRRTVTVTVLPASHGGQTAADGSGLAQVDSVTGCWASACRPAAGRGGGPGRTAWPGRDEPRVSLSARPGSRAVGGPGALRHPAAGPGWSGRPGPGPSEGLGRPPSHRDGHDSEPEVPETRSESLATPSRRRRSDGSQAA
jgi:hypothetical protein